ncbi:MAG TPA: hypothetical protein VN717_00840, partial [Gemmatimonadaceae bacterium]|nr:hypothetical protein [Gemmatimonadaceae bacterium]
MRLQLIAAASLCGLTSLASQQPAAPAAAPHGNFDFSIKGIMRGHDLVGRTPTDVRWSADSRWIYFSWNPPGTDWRAPLQPYRVRAEPGARPESLTVAQMDSAGPAAAAGDLSADMRLRAVEWNGDIFVVDQKTFAVRRLTSTGTQESDPHFDRGAHHVYFVRDNNAFSFDLGTGEERQLTDIRTGPKPKEEQPSKGQRASLEAQQIALLDVIKDQVHADSLKKHQKALLDSLRPSTLWLEKDETVRTLSVSPAGDALVLLTVIPAGD